MQSYLNNFFSFCKIRFILHIFCLVSNKYFCEKTELRFPVRVFFLPGLESYLIVTRKKMTRINFLEDSNSIQVSWTYRHHMCVKKSSLQYFIWDNGTICQLWGFVKNMTENFQSKSARTLHIYTNMSTT